MTVKMEFNSQLVEDIRDIYLAENNSKVFLRHLREMAGIPDVEIETMDEFEEIIKMMEM